MMQEILIHKLHQYIRENNPDLLLQLEEDKKVTEFLSNKISAVEGLLNQSDKEQPAYIIEEACMDILTQDLRPSKFNYICTILEEVFEASYQQLHESGMLQFEVINLINHCQPVFDTIGFTEENEDNWELRYTITGAISEYLESKSENENLPVGRHV
ncbi:MAG TPA: DUF1896 family protein [Hanamia sp.]